MALTPAAARGEAWRAWAGLFGAAAAWLAHQQVLTDLLHFDCTLGGPLATTAGTVAALGLCAGAVWVSWRVRAATRRASLRFVADLSLLGAALFAALILLQTVAGLLLPACAA
jgi:hypothetical protein